MHTPFNALWHSEMHDVADIGIVDSHAICDRGTYNFHTAQLPQRLDSKPLCGRHASVVVIRL
jgi:hypothetical protein